MKFHVHVYKVLETVEYQIEADDHRTANQMALDFAKEEQDWQKLPKIKYIAMTFDS